MSSLSLIWFLRDFSWRKHIWVCRENDHLSQHLALCVCRTGRKNPLSTFENLPLIPLLGHEWEKKIPRQQLKVLKEIFGILTMVLSSSQHWMVPLLELLWWELGTDGTGQGCRNVLSLPRIVQYSRNIQTTPKIHSLPCSSRARVSSPSLCVHIGSHSSRFPFSAVSDDFWI